MIRKSTTQDRERIEELMHVCFGDKDFEAYENLEGRYYLYIVNNEIVAMTGIIYTNAYKGLEIDWTCTHPKHRHKGYMQELFKEMLKDLKKDVYCSCWRIVDKDRANLQTLMEMFRFEKVVDTRTHWKNTYNCFRENKNNCVYHHENCECYEDLYLRRYKKDSK